MAYSESPIVSIWGIRRCLEQILFRCDPAVCTLESTFQQQIAEQLGNAAVIIRLFQEYHVAIRHGNVHHTIRQRKDTGQFQQVTVKLPLCTALCRTVQIIIYSAVGNIQDIGLFPETWVYSVFRALLSNTLLSFPLG